MKKIKFLLILLLVIAGISVFAAKPLFKLEYPLLYKDEVEKYSEEFSLDPYLVFAVIKEESGFRPNIVSHRDANGLMQITYDTFQWAKGKLGGTENFEDIFEPEVNIKYGSFILSFLIEDFNSQDVALAAYNAGRGNVRKWLLDEDFSKDKKSLFYIPFKETREYVEKVNRSMKIYAKLYPDIN